MERRTLIRLLVGLGIGIPVAIEGATFLGLLTHQLGGDDSAPTPTPQPQVLTPHPIMSSTDPAETLTAAVLDRRSSPWTLSVTVVVENTSESSYEFTLGPVKLADGSTVSKQVSTETLEPGQTTVLSGEWSIPSEQRPVRIRGTGALTDSTPLSEWIDLTELRTR